jgi:hypothetical protein
MTLRHNKRGLPVAIFALITSMSVIGAALVVPSAILADNNDGVTTFTVDVAQDSATNVQNDVNPKEGQEVFTRGDTFILGGTIYPGGTLPAGKANNNPNAPGGIGKYRMTGTNSSDSKNFERAIAGLPADPVLALGTEIFSLPDDRTTILTEGLWPNAHFAAARVVLGGTGNFREVVGEAYEENLGENATGFCNLRITFRIRKAGGQRN